MKKVLIGATAFTVIMGTLSSVMSEDKVHWGYSGSEGPDKWATLDESFGTCASGVNQSPIDIRRVVKGELPPLQMTYAAGGGLVVNNGHTIQVNYTPGSTLKVGEREFELKQFHFHAPSENALQGQLFPMEVHFVHADKTGNLAVVGVMFKAGEHNPELDKAWAHMPSKAGGKYKLGAMVDASKLMPESGEYYRFSGSLTTPPCTEGVNWFVMKDAVTASEEQIKKFSKTIGHANNRPVQPLNARVVVE